MERKQLTGLIEFHKPIIIRITLKSFKSVTRNLILEINLRNRRTDVMRMKVFLGTGMLKTDDRAQFDVGQRFHDGGGIG